MVKSCAAVVVMVCGLVLAGCGGAKDSGQQKTKTDQKTPSSADKPKAPLVPKVEIADWCPEHGVPESICTRCNESLTAGFKEKNDWCNKHSLPDSQCFECHPELKAKFDAMKPKSSAE